MKSKIDMERFTCINGVWTSDTTGKPVKTAPMQVTKSWTGGGHIPYSWAEEAYIEYSTQYGTSQTLERLNERGGFGAEEIIGLLIDRIHRIERDVRLHGSEAHNVK